MVDIIETLKYIYPTLQNGQKTAVKQVKEAVMEMQAHIADLESTLARQPLPEAPASATAKVVDPATQTEWLLTFRFHTEDELLEGVARITGKLPALGVIGKDAYIDSRGAERASTKVLPDTSHSMSPIPADTLTFRAETLERSTKGEKTYYKVKGPKFPEFGVTVWPEVLADAGFDLDTLGGVTPLTGYTAHYILNENGKPAKVVGLQPA